MTEVYVDGDDEFTTSDGFTLHKSELVVMIPKDVAVPKGYQLWAAPTALFPYQVVGRVAE